MYIQFGQWSQLKKKTANILVDIGLLLHWSISDKIKRNCLVSKHKTIYHESCRNVKQINRQWKEFY